MVEFTIEPEPLKEWAQIAGYHAPCYEQWEILPYVMDGQPCELYKRRAEPR